MPTAASTEGPRMRAPVFEGANASWGQTRPSARQSRRKCGSEPDKGFLATKPRDLERFIDSYREGLGGVGARGSRATLATSHSASISWDGLALDPRPFARFDEHDTLTLTKRPAGSTGARVIDLEGHPPGGIFGRPATVPGRLQWTVEQETSRILSPDNPFGQAAANGGSVGAGRPYFNSTVAVVPKVQAVRPPTCLPRAGRQGDRALLTPEERRQINDYEVKMESAMRVGRKARHQKIRLDFIMRHRYPEGAIGVDSPYNPFSEVHAEKRSIRENKEAVSCAQAAARRQRLDDIRGSPYPRFGFNPWEHPDLPKGGGIQHGISGGVTGGGRRGAAFPSKLVGGNGGEHFLQSKKKQAVSERRESQEDRTPPVGRHRNNKAENVQCPNTHHNIFERREKTPKTRYARSQTLWDEGVGRRRYDIVSGKRFPLETVTAERSPGRLAHPSQQSLERGRNLQGSLIPV